MTGLGGLIRRNIKLFFKDKGLFFTSLITPVILLVLYATFLGKVYKDSFLSASPELASLPGKLLDGLVGGQLLSSLLAVSCVTVCFCSNMLSVQDKVTGVRRDLTISPVSETTLALGYYLATEFSALIVCFSAAAVGFVYLAAVGWYLSVSDIFLILGDVVLITLFGTALSSVINCFLSSQGQISAVGTIVSSGYGFISGAYMPISNFPLGLQKVVSFLPGTYGTSLLREHSLRGVFAELLSLGMPEEAVGEMGDAIDVNLYFFGSPVSIGAKYAVLTGCILLFVLLFVLISRKKRAKI